MAYPHASSFAPGWLILLVGIALGQSGQFMDTLESVLTSFQTIVNTLVVPVYTLSVLLYLVQLFFPRSSPNQKVVPPVSLVDIPEDKDGVVNMTGSYKLVSNDNFEGFLETQGVPWALRRAANQARPTHKITHVGDSVTIQIKGIIESETTYIVGGPPVETKIRGRVFMDQMEYVEDGIQVKKIATEENYDITVTRRLSPDRQTITLTSQAIFKDGRDPVQAVQIFRRIE